MNKKPENLTEKPNVILIMCDQLRFDCLGCMGHPMVRTPNLDRLAKSGVVFENAYCSSPVCSPARASWLTGLYPHSHGQMVNYTAKKPAHLQVGPPQKTPGRPGTSMREDCLTLGDAFHSAGYRCGIAGPWHLGKDEKPQHGFEEFWRTYRYQGPVSSDRLFDYFGEIGVENLYDRKNPRINRGVCKMSYTTLDDPRQQRTTWTMDRGMEFLEQTADDDRPFFLFLSVKDPHPIIVVSQDLVDSYPLSEIELSPTWRDELKGKPGYQSRDHGHIPSDADAVSAKEFIAHYYALITHIDAEVGRLLQHLEENGKTENTMIAFISDHGEMLSEHGFFGKRLLYDPSVKVPFLLSWPGGLSGGQRLKEPVGGVDLAPTLLDLAGVAGDFVMHGRSVADALRADREPDPKPVFAEIATSAAIAHSTDNWDEIAGHVMVRDGNWKFVWNRYDFNELYDLGNDPGEMKNLMGEPGQEGRVEKLKQVIREMLEKNGPAGRYGWCEGGKV